MLRSNSRYFMRQVKLIVILMSMLSFNFLVAQTCPSNSRNPWEWPSHNNWYFGNGSILNFTTGVVTAGVGKDSYEGVSTASDDNGNLLFFTNGRLVWNNVGGETYNGLLTGNENGSTGTRGSASQGVITIKHPLDPDSYYILTTDDALSGTSGLNYFEIDPSGNHVNGPVRLGAFRTTEAISATLHENGVDVWVMVAESNSTNFHAFLLKCDGFDPNPVTSGGGVAVNADRERGGAAFSWDGNKFAYGHPDWYPNGEKELLLFDFDKSTGLLSNAKAIGDAGRAENPYDIVFSPDNNRLYWTTGGNGQLWSADISSNNAATIRGAHLNSGVSLASFSSLALGGDGSLYMSSSGQGLRRISGDINSGAGLVKSNQLGAGNLGLPTLYLPPTEEPDIEEVGPFCDTDGPVDLNTIWLCAGTNAEEPGRGEYVGDGITDKDYGIFNPATAGEGLHRIIFTFCEVDDTIWIQVNECGGCAVDVDNVELTICAGESVTLDPFVLSASGIGTWTIDSMPVGVVGASIAIGADTIFNTDAQTVTPGVYKLMFTNVDGPNICKDSIYVTVNELPNVDLGDDRSICPDAPDEVFDAGAFATWSWCIDANGNDQEFSSNEEGEYAVAVTDANGCADSDTVILSHFAVPVVDLGEDRSICPGAPEEIFDAGAFDTYNWYIDAAGNTQEFSSNKEGEYAVAVTSANGCADSDTVVLSIYAKPIVDLGEDRTICEGAPAEVFDAGIFDSYKWEEDANGNNQQFASNQAGTFTVIVEDLNGCSDSDTVILNVIPLPTPNVISDVAICPGMNQGFDVSMYDNGNGPYTYSWSDGSNGSSINVNAAGVYWVDITDVYGCTGRDEAELTIENDLTVNIFSAPEIQLCAGEDTILRTNYNAADGYNFTWTGLVNSNDETIVTIQNSGIYEVKVDNGLGCEGDAEIEVIITPLPEPDPQDAEFCEGESVNIGLGMGASYNYSWDNGEATEFIEVNSSNISSPYEVTVTNALTGCEAKANINVTEHINPIVILDDVAVCEGIPVELRSANNYVNVNYSWTGGANTETINPANGGNYTLTVTDEFGCEGSDDATVTFFPIPEVDLGEDTVTICEGEEHTFDAGNEGKAIQWNNGAITSKVKGVETYKYVVSVEEDGCAAKDSAQLIVVPLPESQIDKSLADEKVCFEELDRGIEVVANNSDAYEYLWSDNSNEKSVTVTEPGTYTVKISAGNCAVTDYIVFEEFCPWTLFVPNAFTPDGDGLNDSFNAEVHNVIDYQMLIYNRWGQLIYESNSIENDWDGTFNGNPVQIDVYVYKIYFSYQQENGGVIRSQKVGRVTVLR